MSKKKQKKFTAEIAMGLSDGTTERILRSYPEKLGACVIAQELEKEGWIQGLYFPAFKGSEIVSIKQITWSEE